MGARSPRTGEKPVLWVLGESDAREAAALVSGEYWNVGVPRERLERAMRGLHRRGRRAGCLRPTDRDRPGAERRRPLRLDGRRVRRVRLAWPGASGRTSSACCSTTRPFATPTACASTRATPRRSTRGFGFVETRNEAIVSDGDDPAAGVILGFFDWSRPRELNSRPTVLRNRCSTPELGRPFPERPGNIRERANESSSCSTRRRLRAAWAMRASPRAGSCP